MAHTAIPIYDICSLSSDGKGQEDIMVHRFGSYLQAHHNLNAPHRHSFYHCVLFTKGEGTHAIDFVKFPVFPNQLYFMIPGQVHSWNFTGKTDGYIINFSRNFFYSFLLRPEYLEQFPFLSGVAEAAVISLPEQIIQEIVPILEAILNEAHQKETLKLDMMRVLLLQVFLSVNRVININPGKRLIGTKAVVVRNFQNLVEEHYKNMRLPKDYARLLYVTPNHLNALCKEIQGKSAGEVIRDRVLLEAKRLLTNADLSISEIGFQLNFNDNSYFTKFFKKYTALTPEEFRENHIYATK